MLFFSRESTRPRTHHLREIVEVQKILALAVFERHEFGSYNLFHVFCTVLSDESACSPLCSVHHQAASVVHQLPDVFPSANLSRNRLQSGCFLPLEISRNVLYENLCETQFSHFSSAFNHSGPPSAASCSHHVAEQNSSLRVTSLSGIVELFYGQSDLLRSKAHRSRLSQHFDRCRCHQILDSAQDAVITGRKCRWKSLQTRLSHDLSSWRELRVSVTNFPLPF